MCDFEVVTMKVVNLNGNGVNNSAFKYFAEQLTQAAVDRKLAYKKGIGIDPAARTITMKAMSGEYLAGCQEIMEELTGKYRVIPVDNNSDVPPQEKRIIYYDRNGVVHTMTPDEMFRPVRATA